MANRDKAIAYRTESLRRLFVQLERGTYWHRELSDETREEAKALHLQFIRETQAEIAALTALPEGSEGAVVLAAIASAKPLRTALPALELNARGIMC